MFSIWYELYTMQREAENCSLSPAPKHSATTQVLSRWLPTELSSTYGSDSFAQASSPTAHSIGHKHKQIGHVHFFVYEPNNHISPNPTRPWMQDDPYFFFSKSLWRLKILTSYLLLIRESSCLLTSRCPIYTVACKLIQTRHIFTFSVIVGLTAVHSALIDNCSKCNSIFEGQLLFFFIICDILPVVLYFSAFQHFSCVKDLILQSWVRSVGFTNGYNSTKML